MAIRSQIRTAQVTGSFGAGAGQISDSLSPIASGSFAAANLTDILAGLASATKRITGAPSSTEAAAGVFTHALTDFSGDIKVGGNDIQDSGGNVHMTMTAGAGGKTTFSGDVDLGANINLLAGNDAVATLTLQADNSDDDGDDWRMEALTTQQLQLQNNINGSYVSHLEIIPNATVANSVTDVKGILRLGANGSVQNASQGQGIQLGGDVDNVTVQLGKGTGLTTTIGDLKVSGNDIQNSAGVATITMDGSQNVSVAADLTVLGGKVTLTNGAIIDSETNGKIKLTEDLVECSADLTVLGNDLDFAAGAANIGASVGANDLTLGASNSTVIVPGDLNVNGTMTVINTTNLQVKDPVIAMGTGATVANSNGGIAIMSGSNAGTDLVFGRIANDTMAVGILDTQSGSVTSVAGMAVTNFRASALEVAGNTNFIDINSTNLRMVAAVDIVLDPAGGDVKVDGNMVPNASNGGQLGGPALQWSDLFLAEGGVINWDGGDMTLTQTGDLLSIAGGNTRVERLELDGATNYLDVATDLIAVAAADVRLQASGSGIQLRGGGTNDFISLQRVSTTVHYMNFAADDSSAAPGVAAAGFGFRNNAGAMQFKNDGGSWTSFSGDEVSESKTVKAVTGTIAAGARVFATGNGFDVSDVTASTNDRVDIFVNGQLMVSSSLVTGNGDYALDATDGQADCDILMQFALEADDVVSVIVR